MANSGVGMTGRGTGKPAEQKNQQEPQIEEHGQPLPASLGPLFRRATVVGNEMYVTDEEYVRDSLECDTAR